MNKTKVSVIVPIYNAQSTLVRLLGNFLNQTLSDMEIILVDDCSTDGSAQIMQAAKEQYPDLHISSGRHLREQGMRSSTLGRMRSLRSL